MNRWPAVTHCCARGVLRDGPLRLIADGLTYHALNRGPMFFTPHDYRTFLD